MTDDSQIKSEGRRIWPDAKRLEIVHDMEITLTAFNYADNVIDSVSADSMDDLLKRLKDLQPDGGKRRRQSRCPVVDA